MATIDLDKIAKQLAALAAEDSSANRLDDVIEMLQNAEPLRISTRKRLEEARIEIDHLRHTA